MKTFLTALALAGAMIVQAQTSSLAIDKVAAALAGQEASFTQRFTPKGFKTAQVESGTVLFGQLPRMRWSYSAPESKLFVFDGARSWFYVPGDRQVTVADLDDSRKRELPFLLIGDPAARARHFNVRQTARGRSIITTLQPKDAAAMIRDVTLTLDASTSRVQRVEYADREGNRTVFELSGYHPKPATADSFRFSAPAGVQVVHAD